jgi:hypothetical protein
MHRLILMMAVLAAAVKAVAIRVTMTAVIVMIAMMMIVKKSTPVVAMVTSTALKAKQEVRRLVLCISRSTVSDT